MQYKYLEIKTISDFLKENENTFISCELINKILELLTRNLDINYVNDCNLYRSAKFVPSNNTIYYNDYMILNYLDRNINNYKDRISDEDYEKSPIYFLTQILIHEVEHAKQYAMGLRKIPVVDELLANAYHYLFNLIMNSDTNNPAYVLYKENEPFYLLERNVQVESNNKIAHIAQRNNVNTIHDIFDNLHNLYLQCGYLEKTSGSIYETFKGIGLEDEYLNIYVESNLSEDDKAYYGLPVKRATREKVLKKQKNLQVDL